MVRGDILNVGSLFSGIGGIELGFEREGFATKWFVEYDLYCQAVLRKHWPDVPIYGDITKIDFTKLEKVDILTGGFPCQDISIAGKGKGIIEGARSSLWKHYCRAIGELRPKYAVVENVSALTFRGLSNVLADLAEKGYDAEWFDLRASDFGAPHRRERIFIFANASSFGCNDRGNNGEGGQVLSVEEWKMEEDKQKRNGRFNGLDEDAPAFFANRYGERVQSYVKETLRGGQGFQRFENVRSVEELKGRPDIPQPLVCGGNNGVSFRLDRTKCLGNAVVPQCAQFIAKLIKEKEGI